jgi:magnesium transporter
MIAAFDIRNSALTPTRPDQAVVLVYTSPDQAEQRELSALLQIDPHDVESALDADEVSRLDLAPEQIAVIWKRPRTASAGRRPQFEVSSMGLFLRPGQLIVILAEGASPFEPAAFRNLLSPVDVFLQLLQQTIRHYLAHLKVIKQLTLELESKVSTSMENNYLLQLFGLSEDLIYYLHAIEANGAVLARMQANIGKITLSPAQLEALEDLELDNKQCARQAQIYSSVLSDLMDARGSIVNNNMNVLLRNLTLINIVFLPLNLFASIGGMSEFSRVTEHIDWRVSYGILALAMLTFGWGTWAVLQRSIARPQRPSEPGSAHHRSCRSVQSD